jgi:hypothetical protein
LRIYVRRGATRREALSANEFASVFLSIDWQNGKGFKVARSTVDAVARQMPGPERKLARNRALGAYLPLDPDYPAQAAGVQLADAGVPGLLTRSALRVPKGLVPRRQCRPRTRGCLHLGIWC